MREFITMTMAVEKKWEGRVIDGKFPLRQWLGGSDHSVVFLTERGGAAPQKAALKLIPAGTIDSELQFTRWRTASQLSNRNLIRLFEMGNCEMDSAPYLYVVMENADEDLSQILPSRPLVPGEISVLLPPVLDALSYLHGKGFVHSRLKPSNILAINDQVKLSIDDLLTVGESRDKARNLAIYDAPEIAMGTMSPAADVWSLGVTLVKAMSQQLPGTAGSRLRDVAVPESIPAPFLGIARACLRREPNQRCNISDIHSMLRGEAGTTPIATQARSRSKSAPWRVAIPIVIAIVLAAVLFGQKVLSRHSNNPATQLPEPIVKSATTPTGTTSPAGSPPTKEPVHSVTNPATASGEVLRKVLPDVPASARRTITGRIKVGVRVDVDPSGKVTTATLTSPGHSAYFANLARTAARKWEFTAPQVNGQGVTSSWMLNFQFARTSTQATPTRVTP